MSGQQPGGPGPQPPYGNGQGPQGGPPSYGPGSQPSAPPPGTSGPPQPGPQFQPPGPQFQPPGPQHQPSGPPQPGPQFQQPGPQHQPSGPPYHQPSGPPPGQATGPGGTWVGGPGGTAYTAPTAPPPPSRRRSKLGLILGIIGGVVVLAIIATLVLVNVVFVARATDTVEKYFEAIRAGNAAEALSYGVSTPTNTDLLTDEVLRKSNDLGPITAVEVTESTDRFVEAALTIDGERVAARYAVEKVDGQWKLTDAAFQPTFTAQAGGTGEAPLQINGVDASLDDLWLFPGTYEFASGTPNLEWGPESTRTMLGGRAQTPQALQLSITEEGVTAAKTAINTLIATCAKQKVLEPENCPFRQQAGTGVVPDTSTIVWTLPSEPAARWVTTRPTGTELSGPLAYPVRLTYSYTYQGRTFRYDQSAVLNTTFTVDVATDPPAVSFRQ